MSNYETTRGGNESGTCLETYPSLANNEGSSIDDAISRSQ